MNLLLITTCFLLFAFIDAQRERPQKAFRDKGPKDGKSRKSAKWASKIRSVTEKVKDWNRKNPCRPNPCNNGWCKRTGREDFQCVCKSGYSGPDCTQKNICASSPCMNRGKCTAVSDSQYTCKCRQGFGGDNCEQRNICITNPCRNKGRCTPDETSEAGFTCQCRDEFTSGQRCEIVDWNGRVTAYQEKLDEKIERISSDYERDGTVRMYGLIAQEQTMCIRDMCMAESTCDKSDWYTAAALMKDRFNQYKMCVEQVKRSAVCSKPMDKGPCRRKIGRYYYDSETSQCMQFIWGGCGGNKNNFRSADECEKVCGDGAATADPEQALNECLTEFMEHTPDFTELDNENCSDCIIESCSPDQQLLE